MTVPLPPITLFFPLDLSDYLSIINLREDTDHFAFYTYNYNNDLLNNRKVMSDTDKSESWLKEEYKLLSQHYFHEDNYFLKSNTIYISLNAAMIAFLRGTSVSSNARGDFVVLFAIIGLVSVFIWSLSLVRLRIYKMLIVKRIEELEGEVRKKIQLQNDSKFSNILHLRSERDGFPFYTNIPSSILILVLPFVFFLIWCYILVREMV